MAPQYKIELDGSISITLNINPKGNYLEQEEQISEALSEVGLLAIELTLKRLDTDGKPVVSGNINYTSRGLEKKKFQSSWGEVAIDRHVYQSSQGGKLLIPMEQRAKIIGGTVTPFFAKIVSWKYAQMSASKVREDLSLNHRRPTSRCLIQRIGEKVGELAQEAEFEISYALPELPAVVKHVAVSRDGTTTPIVKEGYRETMCGTLSLYDAKGERMHTIYAACAPELGKNNFDKVMDMELAKVRKSFPQVTYIGLADGAKNNWNYLDSRTDVQILDFYHGSEHLSSVSYAMQSDEVARKRWLSEACHDLKHKPNAAVYILRELKAQQKDASGKNEELLKENITYFQNNLKRMNYHGYQKKNFPIGSGVTEAACKVVAKQRLSGSGMKWTIDAAQNMLLLRSIICTDGRWQQLWNYFVRNEP